MRLGDSHSKGLLADFAENFHLGKINGRYVHIEEGVSPIEFHKPDELGVIIEKITKRSVGE
jgi:hypothetical protein